MSNNFEGIVDDMVQKSMLNIPKKENDYYVDGVLYCGNCHSKKQSQISCFGRIVRPHCLCKCEAEKLQKQEEEQRKIEKENIRKQRLESLKSLSMMGEKLMNSTFENWQGNEKLKNICINYCISFRDRYAKNQGLLLYGEPSVGKTYAAASIANKLISDGVPVVMTSFTKFINNGNFGDNNEILNYMDDAKLLILDDLGAERNSPFAIEQVGELIENRINQNKPLILTTNLTVKEMKEPDDFRYKRIYHRVFEVCYPVLVEGPARRLEKAKSNFYEMQKELNKEIND
ncbi:MAG: ATP-binding protein [Christensenellaceae bacterium]|nr:ATP-binding protein [Christensenellaceae bacterium]